MSHIIRAIFESLYQSSDGATARNIEAGPSVTDEPHNVQGATSNKRAPLEASLTPELSEIKDDFNEEYYILPANDGHTALLFPSTFLSEQADGTVIFGETRVDDDDPRERLDAVVQIYDVLSGHDTFHPRIVKYLGTTNSGYRLERLSHSSIGLDLQCPYSHHNDVVLALYQRWALQMLSALDHLHQKNIFLNNVGNNLWLRVDYSIAIANMTSAGCTEPLIPGRKSPPMVLESPWAADADDPGSVKNDLFDCASWTFALMTGNKDPLLMHMGIEGHVTSGTEDFDKHISLCHDVSLGNFDAWPQLDEKLLGSVILKAWRGEYESAGQAIQEAKDAIRACGHELSKEHGDEIVTYDWQQEFEVTTIDRWGPKLRLRQADSDQR
ncbi:hypothetical protein D6C90_07753 [Aureobasidium pullulans]|uniref:Protein kinase domain-containing protein n=1 Tax=Aureobasidium pullulans TaxID=5580 RepID=A0A4S9FA99_AURPU|nr:hypothetical protein D6D12_02968 [Aureobasidium pullulans]THX44701.1 hypothetical protein D6D11_07811 [Aureobasidium pullulans]THZ34402.1 hypothetical protein D6C90_07753 [Aureobasidium pullulans]